ncbi:MAG: hypothetical protein U1E62_09485 [Alsobacter sp.]
MIYLGDVQLTYVNQFLSSLGCATLDPPDLYHFDRVYRAVEEVHGDFLYLLWRTDGRQHKCSLALTENDLDLHFWLGAGETPSLALAAALQKSLETLSGRSRGP